jgi:hypothetical protein
MNTVVISPDIYKNAEEYAKMHNISVGEFVERTLKKALGIEKYAEKQEPGKTSSWKNYRISKEVMDMTFSERKDLVEDYKEEYLRSINERHQ